MADGVKIVQDPSTGQVHLWDSTGKFIGTKAISSLGLPPQGGKNYTDEQIQKVLLDGMGGALNMLGVPSSVTGPMKTGGSFDPKQIGKDLAVDAASTIPLAMMPGGGIAKNLLKGLVSMGAGTGADQLFNNKPISNSIEDALVNTGIGMAVPGLHENKPLRSIGSSGKGGYGLVGVLNKLLGTLSYLNPNNYEPRTVEKMLVTQHPGTGKFLPASPQQVPIKLTDLQKFLEGFGANGLLDSTLNKSNSQDQQ